MYPLNYSLWTGSLPGKHRARTNMYLPVLHVFLPEKGKTGKHGDVVCFNLSLCFTVYQMHKSPLGKSFQQNVSAVT